jgi:hypothetical protein
MSSDVSFSKENLVRSSLWGIVRGVSVHTLIYPLEVIKIRQQCSQGETKSMRIALALFRQEGVGAFYHGLTPQLLKTSIKQVWCWPLMIEMPPVLRRYHIGNLEQQALSGLSIATIDAAISTPLERAKIVSAFKGTSKFSLKKAYKDGWRGFVVHWSKLSVNWVTFLTAQKYLRDQSYKLSGHPLSSLQLTKIGVEVALIVSLVSAPLDIANTLKQSQNLNPSHVFNKNSMIKLYRGWPMNALSLVIHNIASVTLIEKLGDLRLS